MSNANLFNPKDNQALMLAKHMPTGKLWEAVFDGNKNLGKLVIGLAVEYYRLSVLIKEVETEMDINQTNKLATEWERSVGIPDDCFSNNETLETRRLQIREKFSNFGGVQKAEDFERVAAVFGFNVSVTPGGGEESVFPLVFPILFIGTEKQTKHTIVVTFLDPVTTGDVFPLTFPIVFQPDTEEFLRCIFELLAPANVQLLFVFS